MELLVNIGAKLSTCGRQCVDCLKQEQEPETEGDEEPQREKFGNRCAFLFAILGMSVGLGQVWRFPTLAYKMGGGSFLLIYSVILLTLGNAIYFFEIANGQYTSKNCLKVYDKVPLFIGIGWSMISYSFFLVTYYNHMVAFGIYYLGVSINSMSTVLPWSYCPEETNDFHDSVKCFPFVVGRDPDMDGIVCGPENIMFNRTRVCSDKGEAQAQKDKCCTAAGQSAGCDLFNITDICRPREYPSSYYWSHTVTRKFREDSPNFGYLGSPNWWLIVSLFLAWSLNYLTLYKGLKSMNMVMFIMVPLPYVVLIMMLIVTVMNEGAGDGMFRFFTPNLESFVDISVWRTATEQAFYSLGLGMGPLITFGSYSPFSSPCHIDSTIVCVVMVLTSILCSAVVFGSLGVLSLQSGRPFNEVVEVGPGLVFIVYPEVLNYLPGSSFFAILFYIMLINLGSSSVSGIIETVASAAYDIWPATRRYKYIVNAILCGACFLIGLPITFRGGLTVYDAFDIFAGGLTLVPIATLELITVIYIYGVAQFSEDVAYMLGGFYPNRYYRYFWMLGPVILFVIFVYGMAYMTFPDWKPWTPILGWFLFICVMGFIPCGALYQVIKYINNHKLKQILKPVPDHGPKDPLLKQLRPLFVTNRAIL